MVNVNATMYNEDIFDDHLFTSGVNIPSPHPFTFFPRLGSSRFSPYHRFPRQPPKLYRPHLNLSTRESSPSPPPLQVGAHISCLPPEILSIIFSYLDIKDKGAVALVSSSWKEASYNKSVWKNVEAKLHLYGSRLEPDIIQSLTNRGIRRVQILSLQGGFREITKDIGQLTSLNLSGCYNLRDCIVEDAFESSIATLLHLNLSWCKQITDDSVRQIVQSCSELESLELGGCSNITDLALREISMGLRRLKYLNLRSCWSITDEGIRLIAGQREGYRGNQLIERLGLQDCQHLTDESLKFISLGFTNVFYLNLSYCISVTDTGMKYLSKMTSLRELNLHYCDNVSDTGLSFIANFHSRLTSLDVSFCDKITNRTLQNISQGLLNLKFLNLRGCHISNEGIFHMAETLSDLEVLNLGQCFHINDITLHAITNSFKNLRCVDLYGCPNVSSEAINDVRLKLPRCNFNLTLHDATRF